MTNTNVMALNMQAAPVKGAGKSVMNGASDGSSKGNFDEALGRLQQEAQRGLMSAGKDDTSQGKDTGDGGSGREDAPQNPLAMVMALPVQQLAAEELSEEAPAVLVDFSEEALVTTTNASGELIEEGMVPAASVKVPEQVPEQNLRSLLPQSDEAAVKNKDFLAMLSGDLTSGQRAEARGRQEFQPHVSQGMEIPKDMELQKGIEQQFPGQKLDIQSGGSNVNTWQLGQPLADVEPRDPLAAALRQAARPLQQGIQTEATVKQNIQPEVKAGPEIAAVQPQLAATAEAVQPRQESLQALLGNNIVVETEPDLKPLRVMHSQESQGGASFQQNQEGRNPVLQGSLAAALETEETAAAQPSPAGPSTGAVQVNAFQPQVQETAAPAEMPQPPAQPQTDYEVPAQIVEQARLIRSGEDTEMVIHLKPEHLGDLTLKISVTENGAVTASFHSDNAQVRTIIENSLVQLRQELSDQGLKVDSVEVFSGLPDGQLPQGQGQQAWQQGREGRFAGERKPEDYAEEADGLAVAAMAQSQENLTDDGVDYRV